MERPPIERELYSQQALKNIQQWLTKQNINASLYTTDCEKVAKVQLTNSVGRPLALGSGKGDWAVVGAYFEAFEQMMRERSCLSSEPKQLSLKTWLNSEHCHPQCLFSQALKDYQDDIVTYSHYDSLYSAQQYLIPSPLTHPICPEPLTRKESFFFLKRYASNSGWAAGSTFEETVLHGANELIAQHYLSEMYKQYIGFNEYTGEFIRIIPPREIINTYLPYLDDINQVAVVLCETQFGSYFCACVLPSSISPMTSRCIAVSYSQYHSIELALSGLVQHLENYDAQALKDDLNAAKFLHKYDKLSPLADLSELDRLPCVDLSQLPPDQRPFQEHFQSLLHGVQSQGYDILVNRAFHQEDLWLNSTYIPGLERFNIIDTGTWVVPLAGQQYR